MFISDVIKRAKGELTTTKSPDNLNNLIDAFQEWKSDWQKNICQA
jgi:hypothetical protein